MRFSVIRTAAMAVALAVVPAMNAWAQLPENGAPTRAGTKIVNTATATFTDANGNDYAPVTGTLELEVAFQAGVEIEVTNKPTPKSPGTNNWIEYTITNVGNDVDYFQLSITSGNGVSVTGYSLVHPDNATANDWYTDLAAFNAMLAEAAQQRDYVGNNGRGANIGTPDPNTSLVVYVRYDLDADYDKDGDGLKVEVGSGTDPDTKDAVEDGDAKLDPDYVYDVVVTAQDATQSRLPTNDPQNVNQQYKAVFTVENKGSGSAFDWSVSVTPGTNITIVDVSATGLTGGPTSGALSLASGQSVNVTVTYTVAGNAAAGTTEDITLQIVSSDDANVSDDSKTQVKVIRPSLSIKKEAFQNKNEDPIAPGGVIPGATIWYKITVENSSDNSAEAANVEVKDVLPSALEYVSSEADENNTGSWQVTSDVVGGAVVITAKPVDGNGDPRTMAPGEKAVFWIRVEVK